MRAITLMLLSLSLKKISLTRSDEIPDLYSIYIILGVISQYDRANLLMYAHCSH